MHTVEPETYVKAFKPFDVVTLTREGSTAVGFIAETNINTCQTAFNDQVSYIVVWVVNEYGEQLKSAWWNHHELKRHCNIMFKISEQMTSGHSGSSREYATLLPCISQ